MLAFWRKSFFGSIGFLRLLCKVHNNVQIASKSLGAGVKGVERLALINRYASYRLIDKRIRLEKFRS